MPPASREKKQSSSEQTASKLKELLQATTRNPRADAVRWDELRRLLTSLLQSGQWTLTTRTSTSATQKQWNDWLTHTILDQLISQLCERISDASTPVAAKRVALRTLLGLTVALATHGASPSLLVSLQSRWMRALIVQPGLLDDQSMRHLVAAEFLQPHRDLQYTALVGVTNVANDLIHQEQGDEAEGLLQLLQLVPVAATQAELVADPQAFACSLPKENEVNVGPSTALDSSALESGESGDNSSSSVEEDDDDSVSSSSSESEQEEDSKEDKEQQRPSKKRKLHHKHRRHDWTRIQAHHRAWSRAWLALLRLPLSTASLKRVLLFLPQHVLPLATRPLRFADFFLSAYGGGFANGTNDTSNKHAASSDHQILSVLALEGLFDLMVHHGLECRDFYKHLYRLVTPSLFYLSKTYRSRFCLLLDQCLRHNDLLPAHVVAAFVKRLARCALNIPVPATLFVLQLVSNLLRRHAETACLVHRNSGGDDKDVSTEREHNQLLLADAFDATTDDPEKAHALQSSLWELQALEHHYYPAVVTLAKSIGRWEELQQPLYNLQDEESSFLFLTYRLLFEQERKRVRKRQHKGRNKAKASATPLTYTPPTTLFRPDDVFGSVLDVPTTKDE